MILNILDRDFDDYEDDDEGEVIDFSKFNVLKKKNTIEENIEEDFFGDKVSRHVKEESPLNKLIGNTGLNKLIGKDLKKMNLKDNNIIRPKSNSLEKLKSGNFKNKISFLKKMLNMQKILREENENIVKIKKMNNNILPKGLLLQGKKALSNFAEIKSKDVLDQKRPNINH